MIQDVFKSNKEVGCLGNKEVKKEIGFVEFVESDYMVILGGNQFVLVFFWILGVNKEEEIESREKKEDFLRGILVCQSNRSESIDSFGGLFFFEVIVIQCKNIFDYFNDRIILENYFGKIVKVQCIFIRCSKKFVVVYFFDYVFVVLVRKKGKSLYKDMVIFWYRKKISFNKKFFFLKEKKLGDGEVSLSIEDVFFQYFFFGKVVGRIGVSSFLNKSFLVKKLSFLKVY